MIHILGWIGNLGFISGVYALGQKHIIGWYFNILGNIMYLWQSIIMKNYALFYLSIGLILLNIKGIISWSKKC